MLEYSIFYMGALETWADSEVFLAIKFYCQIKSSLMKKATTETAFTPKHILECHFISWNNKTVRLFSHPPTPFFFILVLLKNSKAFSRQKSFYML